MFASRRNNGVRMDSVGERLTFHPKLFDLLNLLVHVTRFQQQPNLKKKKSEIPIAVKISWNSKSGLACSIMGVSLGPPIARPQSK